MEGPTRFGKYQLVERLATGGMAEVFRAKALGAAGFEKDIAIKRILPQFSADDAFVRMFIDEARLAARLQHRNIVQIFDFDQVDGAYYIAMELVEGCDLKRVAQSAHRRGERVPPVVALYVVSEALKGLGYAHARQLDGKPLNLVHRDVSPHNILLSRSGEVKISDFGIAKAQARATATGSGVIKGKLSYMSPEQARGDKIDLRSDLFAAGVVLHELLSGARLFEGDSEMEILAKVQRCEVAAPGVSSAVDAVVLRLLARAREARFPTATEATRALAACPGFTDESDTLAQLVQRAMADAPRRPSAAPDDATLDSNEPAAAGATRTRTESPGTKSRSVQPVSFASAEAEPARKGRGRWLVAGALVAGLAGLGAVVGLRTAPRPVEPAPQPVAAKPAPPPPSPVAPDAAPIAVAKSEPPPPPEPAPHKPTHSKRTPAHAAPAPAAPEPKPAPAPTGTGLLTVVVKPWAQVSIDGGDKRQTPLRDIELPAGPHVATLSKDDKSEVVHFTMQANKPFEIKRDWTRAQP